MLNHLQQPRIRSEEALPEIGSALNKIFLILAAGDFAHAPHQQAVAIVLDQTVPIAPPDHFDHVPAGAAENGLQFLNDFSVTANRSVEPLQIAVHHEDQIVETLTRGQRDRAKRFRLIHLAIAQKCPDLAAHGLLQAAIFEIFDEACLIDCLDWPQTHRNGGEFPEIRHQPRVRIRRETASRFQLAAEVL